LTIKGNLLVDPFMGSGTSAVAATIEGRRFAGCDVKQAYVMIAKKRVAKAEKNELEFRPLERPIYRPSGNEAVAKRPSHFLSFNEQNRAYRSQKRKDFETYRSSLLRIHAREV
jgi:adenine-specific DNA-methyltransferase